MAFTFGLTDFKITYRGWTFIANNFSTETTDFNLQIPTLTEIEGIKGKRSITARNFGDFSFTVTRPDSTTANNLRNMCFQNVIFYPYADITGIAIPSIAIVKQIKYQFINGFDAFEIQIMSRFKTAVIDWLFFPQNYQPSGIEEIDISNATIGSSGGFTTASLNNGLIGVFNFDNYSDSVFISPLDESDYFIYDGEIIESENGLGIEVIAQEEA